MKIAGMTFVRHLCWVEGPLISLYEYEGVKYILKWCDVDDTGNLWMAYPVADQRLPGLFKGHLSWRGLEMATTEYWYGYQNEELERVPMAKMVKYFAQSQAFYDAGLDPTEKK